MEMGFTATVRSAKFGYRDVKTGFEIIFSQFSNGNTPVSVQVTNQGISSCYRFRESPHWLLNLFNIDKKKFLVTCFQCSIFVGLFNSEVSPAFAFFFVASIRLPLFASRVICFSFVSGS